MPRKDVMGALVLAGRSLVAVVAGLAASVAVVLAATALGVLLFFDGDFTAPPTPAWLGVNLAYTVFAGALGGWVAARLAPRAPFLHAVAVALLMVGMSSGGGGSDPVSGVPTWYGPAVTLLGAAGAVSGGLIQRRRAKASTPSPPSTGG